eukprot:TRINITY_DN15117_c0_g1_i1.p1 TRINITY_DN15117_c0_g1~~TRINITY_DN15117_c0_g1_i1.p1  ORF type:complete len:322 (+),score=53.50 TRINITY_DN15117_c0_g1_i1:125-1090(+)
MLEGIRNFNRAGLKPTETIVTDMPVGIDDGFRSIVGAPSAEEVIEYHDPPEQMLKKAQAVAALIRQSRHFVVYTGAGISTAARIPDYRGPRGVWTMQAKGLDASMPIALTEAEPTYTHKALTLLIKEGLLKCIVSTNVDGLHRRAATPAANLAELHGNIYIERCSNEECGKEHYRNFDTTISRNVLRDVEQSAYNTRLTGRLCNACSAPLRDSIVNFNENLPERHLNTATEHSSKADLTLVLGSSMRVSPACELPSLSYKKGGGFCLCNLQKTSFDDVTKRVANGVRIFAKTDEFMEAVVRELGLELGDDARYTPEFDALH